MTSTESRQSRAAMLMHAARRSHFVARIQKYEAKVRQEQQLRALQTEKQQNFTRTLLYNPSSSVQDPTFPLLLKEHVATEQAATSPLQQLEGTDTLERSGVKELKDIVEERPESHLELRMTSCACPKVILRGIKASDVSILAPIGNCTPRPTYHPGVHNAVKPKAALDVNVAALEVKIKKADMTALMQAHAFQCARECLNATEKVLCKHMAYTLKKEFDELYGPAWHCIVGSSFGSYVTHSVGGFVYFTMEKVSVLLFKTTVEPIEH